MKTNINEYAHNTRNFFTENLNFQSGELQEFTPANEEDSGVISVDVKWKSGVRLIIWQTLRYCRFYAVRSGECISHCFHLKKINNEAATAVQRFINDIESGRYDKKPTPTENYLKLVEQRSLTDCMNNTKWRKIFGIISDIEAETGKEISIKYKCISDNKAPDCYWTLSGDEELHEKMYRNIEWLIIDPAVSEYKYIGRPVEPECKHYNFTPLLSEKLKNSNINYEYLPSENVFIVYGYK